MNALDWMLARGSGMTAFLLLSAAVVLGLVVSLRMASPKWPIAVTNDVHRFATVLALWMTGFHLLFLLVDSQAGISVLNVIVPFTSDYRPLATGLGTLTVYLVGAVWVSTAMRKRIGHRRWRQLHLLAFVGYVTGLLHGVLAGSDAGTSWAGALYVTSAVMVAGLTLLRATASTGSRQAEATPDTAPAPARAPARAGSSLPPLRPRPQPESRASLPPL